MPIQNFPDPYITACFINDDLLYVDLHYNPTLTHYHFLWEISKGKVKGNYVKMQMDDSSSKNFPFKCFYNNDENKIYSFYRQGEFFNIDVENLDKFVHDDCTDMSLGDMYLIYNKIVVARSS